MEVWNHKVVTANHINIHYVHAGTGPLVVLLHGFPEFWYAWRFQIPVLAENFTVVAPDLRGYGDTERPGEIKAYESGLLVKDIVEFIRKLGFQKAHIVGHDWGGVIAWRLAQTHPEVIDRLIVLNCPHPAIFAKALRSNFTQMRKSWYIFLFQIPYLPELIFNSFSEQIVKGLFRGATIRKGAFSDEDLLIYRKMLLRPGALTAALNYYRAALRNKKAQDLSLKINVPTLLIWAEEDQVLGKELTLHMEELFENYFHLEYIPFCSHWVNEEQPKRVNELIVNFLTKKL